MHNTNSVEIACALNKFHTRDELLTKDFSVFLSRVKVSLGELEKSSVKTLACSHSNSCSGKNLKRSFISKVKPTVHTNPSRKRSFNKVVSSIVRADPSRKRSFISTVRPPVHTNPSRTETELYFSG